MPDIIQHVVVAREGTASVDREEFRVASLGSPIRVAIKYTLHHREERGWFRLTDKPTVLGGALPVVSTDYDPRTDSSEFVLPTTQFNSRYVLKVRQPIEVFKTGLGSTKSLAESRLLIRGPEHQSSELDVMPTGTPDSPLFFHPDQPKQEFQLLADPFGGNVIQNRAVVRITHADDRESKEPLLTLAHDKPIPGSGRILDDGTGAVFVVQGLRPQRNYEIEMQIDGGDTLRWQATTKTGPFYDQARKQ